MSTSPILAEYLGTFFFVMVILMSGGSPLIIGAGLALVIALIGSISGGHVNPAVSVSQFLQGKLRQIDLLYYIGAQLLGGVSAYYAYRIAQ